MEKIFIVDSEEDGLTAGHYYRASEVDAYREAVKALVEAAKEIVIAGSEAWGENRPCVRIANKAIAAVERLEVE